MKKLVLTSLALFTFSFFIAYSQSGGFNRIETEPAGNTCEVSFNFFGLTVYSGKKTFITTYTNDLTGETTTKVTTEGCGNNGGSWDWPWE
jgi:hypothetical protein